jgi:tetratricopeptide (TPR) repeat protein
MPKSALAKKSSGKKVRAQWTKSPTKGKKKTASKAKNLKSQAKHRKSGGRQASPVEPRGTQSNLGKKIKKIPRLPGAGRKTARSVVSRTPKVNPIRRASIKQYEAAVKLQYSQEYEKAKIGFDRIIQSFPEDKEVLERVKIHLKFCEQKIARKPPSPRTLEDHYNLGIALMNEGKYQESLEQLHKALRQSPNCEYVIYAMAVTNCRTGDLEGALNNLKVAIQLKPENRFLAQRDSDFEPLMQDLRFISIVFPDQIATSSP